MRDSIKSCPFCGGIGYLTANYSYKLRSYFVFVKCDLCGAQGRVVLSKVNPSEVSWSNCKCNKAIYYWNKRNNNFDCGTDNMYLDDEDDGDMFDYVYG